MRHAVTFAAIVGLASIVAGPCAAADQAILGRIVQVKNPSTPDKQRVLVAAMEAASSSAIVGDPTTSGATLTVRVNGTEPTAQTIPLPQGASSLTGRPFWRGDATKGFMYKDPKGEQGPVKLLRIKKSDRGTFLLWATLSGKYAAVSVLPPNPGTDSCVLLDITGGDSYSVKFSAGDGVATNDGAREYTHEQVATKGTCVTARDAGTTPAPPNMLTATTARINCGVNQQTVTYRVTTPANWNGQLFGIALGGTR